jgi:hypothetical protein
MIRNVALRAGLPAAIALAIASFAPRAFADSVTIDFDSLSTPSGGVLSGTGVSDYLGGYGISLSLGSGYQAQVINSTVVTWIAAPSPNNVFLVSGPSGSISFTMNFSTAVDNFGFTRIGVTNTGSGISMGPWSATAYAVGGASLGTVSNDTMIVYWGNVASQSFLFSSTGISYITFTGDAYGIMGFALPMIDSFTYTTAPVPEPTTLALFGLGAAGLAWKRRRAKQS